MRLLLDSGAAKDRALTRDSPGATPLWVAHNGHLEVVRLLAECAACDIAVQGDYQRGTALDAATRNGHKAIVRFLRDLQADQRPTKIQTAN